MTTASDFTHREAELIELLTERFPDGVLDSRIVTVQTLEGGEAETLRFTLNDVSSTDFARSRIASTDESVESLADEAAEELERPAEPIGP